MSAEGALNLHDDLLSTAPAAARNPSAWINPRLVGRIAELDGVRGLAILLVLSLHNISDIVHVQWAFLFRLGWSGVDLFFVLSGFLIGGILLDAKHAARYYQTFYLRRFHRIVPAYAVLFFTFLIGVYCVGSNGAAPVMETFNRNLSLWTYPFFVQNVAMALYHAFGSGWMAGTWSLAVEEQFYLVLPSLIRRLSIKSILRVTVGMIVLAPLLRIAITLALSNYVAAYVLLPCRADALGYGVLVALVCRNEGAWLWVSSHRRYFVALFLVLGVGVGLWTAREFPLMTWIGYAWMAAFYATLLLLVVVNPGRMERAVFRNRLLVRMGTIAYGMYLFQAGFLHLFHSLFFGASPSIHNLPTLGVTVLSLATAILLCEVSWRLMERPLILRARSRYQYGASGAGR